MDIFQIKSHFFSTTSQFTGNQLNGMSCLNRLISLDRLLFFSQFSHVLKAKPQNGVIGCELGEPRIFPALLIKWRSFARSLLSFVTRSIEISMQGQTIKNDSPFLVNTSSWCYHRHLLTIGCIHHCLSYLKIL